MSTSQPRVPRSLTRPRRLVPGDTVALVAPSSGAPEEDLGAGVEALEDWGLKVRVASNVTSRHGVLEYLGGDDAVRAREFEAAWCAPDVAAVVCARGGDGANRMVERLDWSAMAAAGPKVLVGYSDVTTLHVACAQRLGLATLHGPMPLTAAFRAHAPSRELLRATLLEPESVLRLTSPTARTLVPGRARGVLTGGCLSVLAAEIGTPHGLPDPRGAILAIEDTHENVSRLDRMLGHLERVGYLQELAGVVLGSWEGCGDPDQVRALFEDRLGRLGIPVVWELGFGHATPNLTLPLGVEAELDANQAVLTLVEPALR